MLTTIVATALPNEDSGSGASITLALIARALRGHGHDVAMCSVVFPEYVTPDGANHDQQLRHARTLGYPIEVVVSDAWRPRASAQRTGIRIRKLWRPAPQDLYPTLADAAAVRRAVAELRPDALLAYGFAAVAAATSVSAPRFALTSDPPHLALREQALQRWRRMRNPLRVGREAVVMQSLLRGHVALVPALLRDWDAVGALGLQHAGWLRTLGVPCDYYRTPIADPGPPSRRPEREPPTILLIGHLRGTATRNGLRLFRSMLPELERQLGPEGFTVRVVGGYEPPPELDDVLRHPAVRFVGFVDDIDAEYQRADILLVPVSIRLGVRVRILTGLAHGICVVAHEANAAGIPELEHEQNALLAGDAAGLAQEVARAARDSALRARLGAASRRTYEQAFKPDVAGAVLAETLKRVSRATATSARG